MTVQLGTVVPLTNYNVIVSCNNLLAPAGGFAEMNIKLRITELRDLSGTARITMS